MSIVSIETTPNPNSMKLNFSEIVGKSATYTTTERQGCPAVAEKLLDIPGVRSIFVCNDFVTVNREPLSEWRPILDTASKLLGGIDVELSTSQKQTTNSAQAGEISVLIQTFRGIPIQVKAVGPEGERRISLGESFNNAAQAIQKATRADFLKERYWADWGIRYGSAEEIASQVAEEISGVTDANALERLVSEALGKGETKRHHQSLDQLNDALKSPDWHLRLSALQEVGTTADAVPLLSVALKDSHPQVRRLAAAALGATGSAEAVLPLSKALLNDESVGVRRTAGDALSDLGDVSAEPAVCQSLADPNKLVRWRAARFLRDIGTRESLPALRKAIDDPEFEVRLEAESAIQRIEDGLDGSAPAWKRIVENR